MIHRSVPFYKEIIKRQAELAVKFHKPGTKIYDLGCSNGNFGIKFLNAMGVKPFEMIAVDNSEHMLAQYRTRLDNHPAGSNITLSCNDIQTISFEPSSVVSLNLTLQFLPIDCRDTLIQKLFNCLMPGGILLITEKVIHENKDMTDLQQEIYYNFKKENGYSNLEISQKRDALENVLIPETTEEHIKRFTESGFSKTDIWFKWFNFTSFICIK
jgi:tRNA (cmo5U34)-methyltransferase